MIIILGASGVIGSQLHAMAREKGETVIGTYNTQPYPGLQKFDMLRDSLLETNPQLTPSDTVVLLSAYTNPNWIFENLLSFALLFQSLGIHSGLVQCNENP